ncbi:hypothetical protein FH972_026161 [Carpinus fangiana]|uniref:U6 snRNA-associated Sm-like protein LSm1 n=1 Tax=Carpinus fangiana TaxID=176857 RepID=A0A5N6L3I4_9ROSI|nr:hypothetical protein FH972_026161 [Carpinus fangiana]
MPQPPPQLPPQMFTTAASLLDLTDKKLLVALRDGRKVTGILRSWDQFGNLVLQNAVERTFARGRPAPGSDEVFVYADSPRGVYLVRGENVTLMGEIVSCASFSCCVFNTRCHVRADEDQDLDKDDDIPAPYVPAPESEVFELRRAEQAALKRRDAGKTKVMRRLGFEGEGGGEGIEI